MFTTDMLCEFLVGAGFDISDTNVRNEMTIELGFHVLSVYLCFVDNEQYVTVRYGLTGRLIGRFALADPLCFAHLISEISKYGRPSFAGFA